MSRPPQSFEQFQAEMDFDRRRRRTACPGHLFEMASRDRTVRDYVTAWESGRMPYEQMLLSLVVELAMEKQQLDERSRFASLNRTHEEAVLRSLGVPMGFLGPGQPTPPPTVHLQVVDDPQAVCPPAAAPAVRNCNGDCKFQGAESCRTCYPDA